MNNDGKNQFINRHTVLYEDDNGYETLLNALDNGFECDESTYSSDSDHGSYMCGWVDTAYKTEKCVITLDDNDDNIYAWYVDSVDDLITRATQYLTGK